MRRLLLLALYAVAACADDPQKTETAFPAAPAAQDQRLTSDYWKRFQLQGQYPPAKRVARVFEILVKVAEKLEQRRPHLILVETSDAEPWALSLPDGGVVLTRQALELCYDNLAPEQGDARAAFVIGHELAHLSSDHFFHVNAYFAVRDMPDSGDRNRLAEALLLTSKDLRERELLADGKALIYATVAGFDPQVVMRDQGFFERWTSLTPGEAAYGLDHPTPRERADFLRENVRPIVDKLPYFQWGTRFHQAGDYDSAIVFLTRFKSAFAGPAALNNLGLSHLQRGLQRAMKTCPEAAMRLRLPTLRVDLDSLAGRFTYRGGGQDCLENDPDLKEAVELLQKAADSGRPGARLNHCAALTTAWRARESYRCAGLLLEENPSAESELLEVLALYLISLEDRRVGSEPALNGLQELADRYPSSIEIAYNRASIVQRLRGAEEAGPLWRRFLGLEPQGEYARHARQLLGEPVIEGEVRSALEPAPVPPAPIGPLDAASRKWLGGLEAGEEFEAGGSLWRVHRRGELRVLYRLPGGDRDGEIVLIEAPDQSAETEITARFGPPRHVVPAVSGKFLRYSGFGFEIRDGAARRVVFFSP